MFPKTYLKFKSISRSISLFRKTIKKSKDPKKDEERPPWRPVSVAPPSKADKNSLLKAKLLDASRYIFQIFINFSFITNLKIRVEEHCVPKNKQLSIHRLMPFQQN